MSVAKTLSDFLALDWVSYFECSFDFVFRGLLHEETAYIEDGEIVVERKCDYLDLGTIGEIERFTSELAAWRDAVDPIREQWKLDNWDKFTCRLPKDMDFREAFGEYCNELDEIRARCRRILKHIESNAQSQEIDSDKGVTLHDIAIALGLIDEQATDFVSRFSRSKKIHCQSIGKCPEDKRRGLYRLFEILRDLESFSPLNATEKKRISRYLKTKLRKPRIS